MAPRVHGQCLIDEPKWALSGSQRTSRHRRVLALCGARSAARCVVGPRAATKRFERRAALSRRSVKVTLGELCSPACRAGRRAGSGLCHARHYDHTPPGTHQLRRDLSWFERKDEPCPTGVRDGYRSLTNFDETCFAQSTAAFRPRPCVTLGEAAGSDNRSCSMNGPRTTSPPGRPDWRARTRALRCGSGALGHWHNRGPRTPLPPRSGRPETWAVRASALAANCD